MGQGSSNSWLDITSFTQSSSSVSHCVLQGQGTEAVSGSAIPRPAPGIALLTCTWTSSPRDETTAKMPNRAKVVVHDLALEAPAPADLHLMPGSALSSTLRHGSRCSCGSPELIPRRPHTPLDVERVLKELGRRRRS